MVTFPNPNTFDRGAFLSYVTIPVKNIARLECPPPHPILVNIIKHKPGHIFAEFLQRIRLAARNLAHMMDIWSFNKLPFNSGQVFKLSPYIIAKGKRSVRCFEIAA